MSYSAITMRVELKVLVSTTSAAGLEERGMDVLDDVRPAEHEDVVVAVLAPEIVEREVVGLDVGAHGAVVDDDAFLHGFEVVAHSCLALAQVSVQTMAANLGHRIIAIPGTCQRVRDLMSLSGRPIQAALRFTWLAEKRRKLAA